MVLLPFVPRRASVTVALRRTCLTLYFSDLFGAGGSALDVMFDLWTIPFFASNESSANMRLASACTLDGYSSVLENPCARVHRGICNEHLVNLIIRVW